MIFGLTSGLPEDVSSFLGNRKGCLQVSSKWTWFFNEQLWCDPIETLIPTYSDCSQTVRSVNKEVSLAWKLLWLETDIYPEGKDLYDAALLAEQTQLPLGLLKEVLQSGDWRSNEELTIEFPLRWVFKLEIFPIDFPS